MRRASTPFAIGSLLWVAVSAVQAMGFGRVSNSTVLGQPLGFEAVVRLAPGEDLTPQCVFAEVYSGENKLVQPLVRVQLDGAGDASERRIRVRTTTVIDEPVVSIVLTLGCENALTRKFVAFVDPPAIALAQSSTVGEAPLAAAPAASAAPPPAVAPAAANASVAQPGPLVSQAAPKRTPTRPSRPLRVVQRPASDVVATPQPRRTRPQGAVAARPAGAPVARLKLEPAPPILTAKPADVSKPATPAVAPAAPISAPATPAPTTAATPTPAPAVAAAPVVAAVASAVAAVAPDLPASGLQVAAATTTAVPEAAVDALAQERARLKALEDSLMRVRDETQAAQKALVALQARVREAEAQRYANPLVYALAGVSALLALGLAMLWRRQSNARNDPKWWGTMTPPAAAAGANVESPSRDEPVASRFIEPEDEAPVLAKPPAKVIETPEPPKAVPPTWVESRQTEPSPDLLPEPRRDLSVEELIDLEQQAEFFVVLGQDDAAIDLLMGHVRSTGGISPLPYLKLLEIYRRRGDRSAYERIRERFNRRFNAYAPDWDADLQQGRSLEDYPATIARLEALWVMPQRVMETLEASLFRRDETEEAFDLPAYRELLFLYAVARDFAHKADDSSAVDLLLPMDSDTPSAPVARLVASMPSILQGRSAGAAGSAAGTASVFAPDSEISSELGVSPPAELGPLDFSDDPGVKRGDIIRR
jgi:pilus assembly protein FimV